MATVDQAEFIKDLVLQKFINFREFKKWLATTGIVRTNGQIFKQSVALPLLTNKITKAQASRLIDELQTLDDVKYLESYSPEQVEEVQSLIAQIEQEVGSWTFMRN